MLNKKKILFWIIIALGIRLFKIIQVHAIAKDGIRYIDAAYELAHGHKFNIIWPPFYPWLLGLPMRLGIPPELCGQIVSALFGVLTVVMVYILTKKLFSQHIAEISGILAVFHPYLVRYSAEVLADSVFTCLILIVIYFGRLGIEKGNIKTAGITGLAASLAYLTKPEGMFLCVIISFWWFFTKGQLKRKITAILCMWVVFLITACPYLYSVQKQTGHWMISQKQSIAFSVSLQEEGFAEEFLNISPIGYAVNNPYLFTKKVSKNILQIAGKFPDAVNPFLFILILLGMFMKWDVEKRRNLFYILSFVAVFFAGYAVFYPGRRYLVNWVPEVLFLAAFGCEKTAGWIAKLPFSFCREKIGCARIVVVCIIILFILPKTFSPVRREGIKWKQAGEWIKDDAEKGVSIMAEDSRAVFYSGGREISWDKNRLDDAGYIVSEESIGELEGKKVYEAYGVKIYKQT